MNRHRAITLLSTRTVGPNVFQQRFADRLIARTARAGQFVHILPGESHLFRRAFSVYATDPAAGTFDILHQIYGEGTRQISQLPKGSVVDALGPLGNQFVRPDRGQLPVLVGGGLGMAPIRLWATELLRLRSRTRILRPLLILGARHKALAIAPYQLSELSDRIHWATDDGSRGFHGNAIELLGQLVANGNIDPAHAIVYGCGPEPMMRALAQECADHQIRCQVSLERSMPCGFGVCMGCVVERSDCSGYETFYRVCRDGPVFDTESIVF